MESMELFKESKEVAFNALFNLLNINFVWINPNGEVLGCNNQMLSCLNMNDPKDYIGKHPLDFSSKSAWENTQKVIETGKSIVVEEVHTKENGESIYFLSMKSPIKSKDGKLIGVVILAINITDRKLMELELAKSLKAAESANQAKTQFLCNIRHDLRTPLSSILNISQFLESMENDPTKKQYLSDLTQSSNILLNHLNDILEYVKIESGEFPVIDKRFDMYRLLDDMEQMMRPTANDKKLDLKIRVDSHVPRNLIGDDRRTERILINLISNALKFTEKGYVKVSVKWISKTDYKGIIQINIEDSGIGIAEDKKEMIFERFNRLHASYGSTYVGTGLGLKLVKQFLEELEGQYDLISELGKGTTFKIFIPYTVPFV